MYSIRYKSRMCVVLRERAAPVQCRGGRCPRGAAQTPDCGRVAHYLHFVHTLITFIYLQILQLWSKYLSFVF